MPTRSILTTASSGILQYERYLTGEVVPFIKGRTGSDTAGVTGCSFRRVPRPRRWRCGIRMCLRRASAWEALFDIMRFPANGYSDTDAYLLSPPLFLPNLEDSGFLDRTARTNGAGHRRKRHLPGQH
ncbi:MAG: hypothetical protein IPL75_13405 [Acidobacteria bacterium]|nr:hypothetical protein [Acidobacteriota bacterium]